MGRRGGGAAPPPPGGGEGGGPPTGRQLRLQGLTEGEGDYLEPHAYSIMQQIEDPEIRGLHVMEG